MSILHYEIEQLKEHIENKMNHKYVDIYIERPQIDQFQMELLYEVAKEMGLEKKKASSYITAIMLVQTALNAHELVQDEETILYSDRQKKEKQLLVLAGDYYSGLYYLLLSEMKDVDMVGALAKGIKQVNEYKMKLYYTEYDTLHELMQLLLSIHSIIIAHVTAHLFSDSVSYVMEKLVQLQYLCAEKKRIEDRQETILTSYIKLADSHHFGYDEKRMIDDYIRNHVNDIEEQLYIEKTVPSSLIHVVERFLTNEVYDISSMAEEG